MLVRVVRNSFGTTLEGKGWGEQPVHSLLGGDALGIQQGTSVWVGLPKYEGKSDKILWWELGFILRACSFQKIILAIVHELLCGLIQEAQYTLTSIMSHHPFHQKVRYKQGVTYLMMSHLEDLCTMWFINKKNYNIQKKNNKDEKFNVLKNQIKFKSLNNKGSTSQCVIEIR